MPKIPRDLTGGELAGLLKAYGYAITRQSGSHIRLTRRAGGAAHHITIPDHSPLKIGTLSSILKELSEGLKLDREVLLRELFRGR